MNNWINQKIIPAVVFCATIATTQIPHQNVLALPSATVNRITKRSTVRIDGAGNGSGVIINEDSQGYIVLTNWHVVRNPGNYMLSTADGKTHTVKEITQLKGADLALVYFDSKKRYPIVKQGNSDTLIEGQKIHIAGYPGSQQVASNRTYRFMSESLVGFLAAADVQQGYELIYSGEAIPGLSGSPIVNEEAELIGIYGLTDIDFTTGASYLYGIPLNTALKITSRAGITMSNPNPEPTTKTQPTIDLFAPSGTVATSSNNGNVGFEVQGSQQINELTIPDIIYTGECPGREIASQKAMFFSTTTTTAPDRRVIITNVTRGLNRDPLPYADREYKRGQVSESTEITIGSEHQKRNFVVLRGQNNFQYEIIQIEDDHDKELVLEKGSFSVKVNTKEQVVERQKQPVKETYCPSNYKNCDYKERRVRTVYKCPGEKPSSKGSGSILDLFR